MRLQSGGPRLLLKVTQLAVLLEQELERIVHPVSCLDDQEVELLCVPLLMLGYSLFNVKWSDAVASCSVLLLNFCQVDNSCVRHLPLEVGLQSIN